MASKPKQKKPQKDGEREPDLGVENELLRRRIETIQLKLELKNEHIRRLQKNLEHIKQLTTEVERNTSAEEGQGLDRSNELKRQLKEMESNHATIIRKLEGQIEDSRKQSEKIEKEILDTKNRAVETAERKNVEIRCLKTQLESMTYEFSQMLERILSKMTSRVELPHSTWESEKGKAPLINRLKEFYLMDYLPPEQSGTM